ncbi:MAG: nucleotidyltransferase domain-containing protein [Planctomycetota bacterium]|jgi:predicted nucleotidyltransferase
MLTVEQKKAIKDQLTQTLSGEREVCRIVIFGSFLHCDDPHDLDVAVFQDSAEGYLPLALKYRRKTREIARIIPIDIIPLKASGKDGFFLDEIEQGETVYER